MTNPILATIEKIGTVIAWPFVHVARTVSIINTTMKDYPATRTAVAGLVTQIETVSTDVVAAGAQGELNPVSDAAELTAAVSLYSYVKNTFLPAIKSAYADEVAAATGAQTAAAQLAATRSAAATKAAATRQAATAKAPPPPAPASSASSGTAPAPATASA